MRATGPRARLQGCSSTGFRIYSHGLALHSKVNLSKNIQRDNNLPRVQLCHQIGSLKVCLVHASSLSDQHPFLKAEEDALLITGFRLDENHALDGSLTSCAG